MPWPDSTDLINYLAASGLVSATPTALEQLLDMEGALRAGIDRWEDTTHFWPFLSTGDATEARRFASPYPSNLLDLNGGLVTITRVTVGVTYTVSSGADYTVNQHYRLLPRDAAPRRKPWTQIEFIYGMVGYDSGEIEVTGEWGYCTDDNLPSAARRGVLAMAAMDLLPQMNRALSQGLVRWTEGDVTKQYATPDQLAAGWQSVVEGAIMPYRRLRIG